jgi:hypothetical protein
MSLQFGIQVIILFVAWFAVCRLVEHYWANETKDRKIHLTFFSSPLNTVLVIMTIGLPALLGFTGFLYKNRPAADYSSLFAALVAFLLVLLIAFWISFSLLQKGNEQDAVQLSLSKNNADGTPNKKRELRFIKGMGAMYGLLLVGFCYIAFFFLFELQLPAKETSTSSSATIYLLKPPLTMNISRSEVESRWGEPTTYNSATRLYWYQTSDSDISLEFDGDGNLMKIEETRKGARP